MQRTHVNCTVNGDQVDFLATDDTSLLNALRDELGLISVKEGCGTGDCGACTIVVDDKINCACLMFAPEAEGLTITTVEGMALGEQLHPLQQTFLEGAALQCGVCTPGFLVAAKALLDRNPDPTETEIRYALAGNLCRCTGYDKIIRATQEAAVQMQTSKQRGAST
ncbi:MAG: (2Fe-2S)-binding protein [Acidimicrobiia bacterium]|nr:(2Fe-2S)-binding protein [Acidimicrobiia bacterium]MCY4458240.1 (2Fe-2S)-binding protein [Acidimicrobiaceae bacterium]